VVLASLLAIAARRALARSSHAIVSGDGLGGAGLRHALSAGTTPKNNVTRSRFVVQRTCASEHPRRFQSVNLEDMAETLIVEVVVGNDAHAGAWARARALLASESERLQSLPGDAQEQTDGV
jgi:hypothetical protein